jgi:RimJ/RimL family protein N-acetyltransferase
MQQLTPDQYGAIMPLFNPLNFNLVIRSVVTGNTPAWVFASHPTAPRVALIWDRQDALLLGGDIHETAALPALRNIIHNQILPDARSRHIPEMAFFCTPGWEQHAALLFTGLNPSRAERTSYRYPQERVPISPPVPRGFTLHRIDDGLLASNLDHIWDVRGWIDSFWASEQAFLNTGFGYAAVTRDTIASWCLTVFAAGSARELGVATLPDYRRRGLGTMVAEACIEHGLAHGFSIHWHCWSDNLPSAAAARRLGFEVERDYSVFRFNTGLDKPAGGPA